MQYINIHTHQPPARHQAAIINLHQHFEAAQKPGKFSIGLHPWYIGPGWHQQVQILKVCMTLPQVVAIGECGLDKACDTDLTLQLACFESQVQLANECNKPVIIHCVKAFDEVLQVLKYAKVPAVFHGFVKSRQLAQRIIEAGHYISFGKALREVRLQQVLSSIPADNFFLETDDDSVTIEEIYQWAAQALSVKADLLSLQIQKNVFRVFNITV